MRKSGKALAKLLDALRILEAGWGQLCHTSFAFSARLFAKIVGCRDNNGTEVRTAR
jgi:hypothetical protein